jgi:hypothetical protein
MYGWANMKLALGSAQSVGSVLTVVLSLGSTDWDATNTFDPGFESGKWAIRFLPCGPAASPFCMGSS